MREYRWQVSFLTPLFAGWWWMVVVAFVAWAWLVPMLSPFFGDDDGRAWLAIAITFMGVTVAFAAFLIAIPPMIVAVQELCKRGR